MPDTSPLIKRLSLFAPLSDGDVTKLKQLEGQTRRVPPRTEVVRQGDPVRNCLAVRRGWSVRAKLMADGRRQITDLVLPGDLVGLYADVLPVADQTVITNTAVEFAEFPPDAVAALFFEHPRLAAAFAWTAAREQAILAEKVTCLGRRTAYERVAHFLLEVFERLRVVGLTEDNRFTLPISQEAIADTLGLSPVHVNRMLARLRQEGAIRIDGTLVELLDLTMLKRAADYDELYLLHRRLPAPLERRLAA